LLASASDDGSLNIIYAMVYNDLLQNALVTPVKVLKGAHKPDPRTKLGAMSCEWHPNQPWLFTAGADGKVKLWV
jgi:ribosome biogenesis protein ERB1